MPEHEQSQPPPPPPASQPEPAATSNTTGLPSNIAAAMASLPLIGGFIFYLIEKQDNFVRFYAMQSIIYGGAWLLFYIVWKVILAILVPIPVVGWIIAIPLWITWAVVHIGFLVVMIITIVKALTGVRWDIPYVGPIARKQMGEG
jgi:uncharacterized membrane protein